MGKNEITKNEEIGKRILQKRKLLHLMRLYYEHQIERVNKEITELQNQLDNK